ncbi:uncharacterized protein LOC123709620 isoform X4 [Pieris brassicae]|uniref:uncharacterized protein LOC123709620 isoform X4 n=1 Tax=Pieris brassicae TaxID=7116 RepID=UPI001E661C0A|nr:uncharacterized protein LOC123709620 isoform X4 [Pieris brassicae]
MNGRSDASTSTDDVLKGQPLCLFYFTHPFGVVSPEPPLVTAPPSHLARCFANTPFSTSTPDYCSDSTPLDELLRRDSFSSLLSSSLWLSSGSGERRVLPCHRLPPLRLPSPPPVPTPPKALAPAPPDRVFLPPIQLSLGAPDADREWFRDVTKRPKLSGVRRMLTGLVRRNIEGGTRRRRRRASPGVGRASPSLRRASPALREALRVLRDAWPSPAPLRLRFRGSGDERSTGASGEDSGDTVENTGRDTENQSQAQAMWWGGASPGLLRRRYSVPETIMRKYRLAQQRTEWEEESARESAPACGRCTGECGGVAVGDMRKSALLRVWGRAEQSRCRCGATRSLDGSRCELRQSSRCVTPKRPRLDALSRSPDPTLRLTSSAYSNKSTKSSETALFSTDTSSNFRQKILTNPTDTFSEEYSFTEPSDPTSMPTAKEIPIRTSELREVSSSGSHIDGRVSEDTLNAENEDCNVLPYNQPLSIDTQQYEILEIVVSETLNVQQSRDLNYEGLSSPVRNTTIKSKKIPNINIDEYVSNILVESLNSLTDQLESINASMGYEKRLNIVEKEIKVKLQNTGVNTIVHLSPTSNNQIIFGNEELCNNDGRLGIENDVRNESSVHIRDSALSVETNNNLTSAESVRDNNGNGGRQEPDGFLTVTNNDSVNKAILQQIQKLFKDEFKKSGGEKVISHTQTSNVDIDLNKNIGTHTNSESNNSATSLTQMPSNSKSLEVLGGVGARNYYEDVEENTLIPRLSALPHSDSMEVNTSSSDDTDMLGSECASLVDSLDDPNSPRCALLRRSRASTHRADLVRSAIDVLDLLPENAQNGVNSPKEKGESFFVRIKDGDCDCEKENMIVADHMPETIKQRLFRRHRKREQRMECVKRTKVKQLRRDVRNKQNEDYKFRKEIEKECFAIVNALIDDVIAKIVQNEYKNLRIKQQSYNVLAAKSEENLSRKSNKKEKQSLQSNKSRMIHSQSCSEYIDKKLQKLNQQQHVKSSVDLPPTVVEPKPKRIYQKSEIYDGSKCIEILEILEYANTSQNSSDTTNSDENHNNFIIKSKKSRIPIPVYERIERLPKSSSQKKYKNDCSRSQSPQTRERNQKTKQLLASMLFDAFAGDSGPAQDTSHRRPPVPCETRARSNSLRFHNPFDIIPEEKSSLSMESTGEESAGRRASAPSLADDTSIEFNEKPKAQERLQTPKLPTKYLKNAGTSPMPELKQPQKHVGTATSPSRKSAATSPRRPPPAAGYEKRKSVTTQCDETVKTIKSDTESNNVRKIKSHNCLNNHTKAPQKQTRPKCEREKYKSSAQSVGCDAASEESSSSGESDAALVSPAWLATRRRRRAPPATRLGRSSPDISLQLCRLQNLSWILYAGEWAVTVAGSCAAALPNDVEMRLRFPDPRPSRHNPHPASPPRPAHRLSESCTMGSERARRGSERLTLTVKKEASDSSVVASKSMKKSRDLLPELQETFRASRTDTRSSLKAVVSDSAGMLPSLLASGRRLRKHQGAWR